MQEDALNPAKNDQKNPLFRQDILQKTQELAKLLQNSEEVQLFRKAEDKIKNHQRIQQLIAVMKKKQKEIVAFESLKNTAMVAKIEHEIEQLQTELDGIPVVSEFQQSQVEINELLQMIMGAIRDTVSEKVSVETGKDAPSSSCSD
ncbi:YlbF family regulator [Paenibacillus sp. P96]|uniref:YlbF family regulator n=2 Tax=Paenibacillus zeirhizosphaerae TaxID=2987519 RepID=A0ABT9FRW7_9BACL|nr:YlbF family regulator [Paenibacillus sp. P96]MDP4097462.1 YlbF family regulator [Paenibacillus sp. P96]